MRHRPYLPPHIIILTKVELLTLSPLFNYPATHNNTISFVVRPQADAVKKVQRGRVRRTVKGQTYTIVYLRDNDLVGNHCAQKRSVATGRRRDFPRRFGLHSCACRSAFRIGRRRNFTRGNVDSAEVTDNTCTRRRHNSLEHECRCLCLSVRLFKNENVTYVVA